jgi:L-threonylcarbamoyladenylate synthase
MNTLVLHTLTAESETRALEGAVRTLAAGDTVALPTETVYGLAADATRPDAVAKIFEAKERPFFDPLIVHLPADNWLEEVARIPEEDREMVENLTRRFWPGPLTLVLPRGGLIPDLVTAGLETVAVRRSAHRIFELVIGQFGKPLAAPSANRFGRMSPTEAAHVMTELSGRIPMLIDAGPAGIGVESTIVTPGAGQLWILRPGPVTAEELGEFGKVTTWHRQAGQPDAPGRLKSHYAPRTRLQIEFDPSTFRPASHTRCGLLAWNPDTGTEAFLHVEYLSRKQDLVEAAARLFAALRDLDAAGLDLILAEPVPRRGLGVAIMDRLEKAAAHG